MRGAAWEKRRGQGDELHSPFAAQAAQGAKAVLQRFVFFFLVTSHSPRAGGLGWRTPGLPRMQWVEAV